MTTIEPRTETRVGGPWSRRSEAAQLPRLYQDDQDDPVDDDVPAPDHTVPDGELADLARRAGHDDRALALLMSRPETLRRVLELLARYDAQADWFCALAERQLVTVERLQAELVSERIESVRLQTLNAERCAELQSLRDTLVDAAAQVMELDAQLVEARSALLQLSVQVAVAVVAPRIPPARTDFGGDTESYPSDVLRGDEP